MQIHMIGHASIFVETQDSKILIDPVLFEPHGEGMEDICPKREVITEKIPEFDLLIISHQHIDHFDIRSLAFLPKNVDVLIPKDKILQKCLQKLGYSQIYPLGDFDEVKIGSTNILTTRSEYRVPEFGILIADPSGVFWNQVDSDVSLDTIRFVKSRYPQIDFLLAPWQPMLELNYQDNLSLSFPHAEYNKILEKISLIKPKMVAPGANGFKFINESSCLNQITFPVTREQFCRDVGIVCPEVEKNIFPLDPGDIFTFNNSEFHHMKGSCKFVNKLEDDRDELDFAPVNIGKNLIDSNPENFNLDEMKKAIEEEVCLNLPKLLIEKKDSLFIEHCHWQVIYQLEIVFPDCVRKYFFDFSQNDIQAIPGRNPLANLFTTITASSFYSLLKGIKGWDYFHIGGYYRNFNKIYVATHHGIIKPDKTEIQDPLEFRFPYNEAFEKVRYQEIETWGQAESNDLISHERKTFMMKVGNTIVRLAKTNNNINGKYVSSMENLQLVTASSNSL